MEKENRCPSCGKPRDEWNRRKDWRCCSKECTEKYWKELVLYYGWSDLREKALKRDNYRCVKCSHQPTTIRYHSMDNDCVVLKQDIKEQEGHKYKEFTIVDKSKLIADHIKPIALGGDEWDIDNVQTLCEDCNKTKTALDQTKIAELRAIEKKLSNGQKQLR